MASKWEFCCMSLLMGKSLDHLGIHRRKSYKKGSVETFERQILQQCRVALREFKKNVGKSGTEREYSPPYKGFRKI